MTPTPEELHDAQAGLIPEIRPLPRWVRYAAYVLTGFAIGNCAIWLAAHALVVSMAIAEAPLSGCEGLSAGECAAFAEER